MPKPWFGRVSSGMHAHMSLVSKNSKRNAFFDPKGFAGISQLGRYFIGGLLEHARALAVIVAPTVNSYKRLVPHLEAPVYAAWSKGNRSDLVRIPEYFVGLNLEKEARAEFRCPDALSNPYLDYAVLFEAGLDGIKKKIDPGDPMEDNVYELSEAKRKELHIGTLPGSLKEALEEWNNDDICVKALGKETAEKFREAKNKEWKEYEPHMPKIVHDVTAWEVKKYLFG
jgi:glutamine synthetase